MPGPRLYDELVDWYFLVDPTEDHADEAESYRAALHGGPPPATVATRPKLLDLGAGAGNNAFHLKAHFDCTLTDLSEPMLALSRDLNPECEHILGDMRSLKLGRTFDAVLVHDAVMYMTTESDLLAAIQTAFDHTRRGGVAVFAPDCFRETFDESFDAFGADDFRGGDAGERSARCLEWKWDPSPDDTTYVVDYAFMLRENGVVRTVHDRHVEGLFAQSTWLRLFARVGFEASLVPRALGEGESDSVFLCRRG